MRNLIMASVLAITAASSALADDIQLGEPSYNGSGCLRDTASVTLSPDARTLSILFADYVAEAGGITGRRVDRKSCNIAIPVHVPGGYSVSILAVDYRGYANLPRGSYAQFDAEYFFAGDLGPHASQRFNGPEDTDFLISHRLIEESLVWSACGDDVTLRVNSSMRAVANPRRDQTLAMVDSADVQAGLIYHLVWRRCHR